MKYAAIITTDVTVGEWKARTPAVSRVRPATCPSCAHPSRPIGEGLGLYGHGLRDREVRLPPLVAGGSPTVVVLDVRRYVCRQCGATCTVGPAGLLARRRFSGLAIAAAFVFWALDGQSASAVRRAVSVDRTLGETAKSGWAALKRWARAVTWGAPSHATSWRARARDTVEWLCAHSPLDWSHSPLERALAAARL
jgi:hypothetical protein